MLSTVFLTLAGGWFGANSSRRFAPRRRRNVYDLFPQRW